jgi:MFS transporter, DHA2 family, multidrug resistance protein
MAPTVGPTIGGYLSHAFSWHWLFLVNVLPGLGVTAAAWLLIDFDKPNHSLMKRFDWIGLAAMAVFLGSLEYVLEEGNTKGWFQDEHIVMGTVALAVGATVFFYRAFKVDFPVVDLKAFNNMNFAVGSLFSFIMGVGIYGMTYLYPLYLGRIRGYDSLMIGETMFVSGLAMFFGAPLSGILSSKLDPRVMMMIGFAGFGASTYWITYITPDWDFWELFIPQILRGLSMMLCMVPINNIALGTLPPQRIANASGLFNLTRNLGGAVGLALINTTLTERTDVHYAYLSERINAGNQAAQNWLSSVGANYSSYGLDGANIAIEKLAGVVKQQAWLLSFMDVFVGLSMLFFSLIFLAMILRKPKAAAPAGAGH